MCVTSLTRNNGWTIIESLINSLIETFMGDSISVQHGSVVVTHMLSYASSKADTKFFSFFIFLWSAT